MTIKLLQVLSVMTLVMLISVGQAMDAFAFKMFTDDGTTQLECDDNENPCDEEVTIGIITQTPQNALCDLVASQVSTATKTAIGTGTMLEIDKDLNCSSAANTLGTLIYTVSDIDFSGDNIVCTTDAGGGATIGPDNVQVKFWVSNANTHFDKQQLLFDVSSDNLGNIPWSGLFAAAAPGGLYSFTMETIVTHDIADQINISTFDLTVSCEPTVGGELLPINTTSLMLGGLGLSLVWMVPVLATAGGAVAYITYKKR